MNQRHSNSRAGSRSRRPGARAGRHTAAKTTARSQCGRPSSSSCMHEPSARRGDVRPLPRRSRNETPTSCTGTRKLRLRSTVFPPPARSLPSPCAASGIHEPGICVLSAEVATSVDWNAIPKAKIGVYGSWIAGGGAKNATNTSRNQGDASSAARPETSCAFADAWNAENHATHRG
jgi:hypothetical protein